MSLTFNGTSSNLALTAATSSIVTAYPFSLFCWVKIAPTYQNGFPFVLEGTSANLSAGGNGSWGILQDTTPQARAYCSVGSGIAAFSSSNFSSGVWTPAMAVFTSASSRTIFLNSGSGVNDTSSLSGPVISGITKVVCGYRSLDSSNFFKGDAACMGLWSSALNATDFASLVAGAVPSTVQSGSLIDYWSCLTQASTQTGVNGRILTATSTSQGSTHPIAEGGGGGVNLILAAEHYYRNIGRHRHV